MCDWGRILKDYREKDAETFSCYKTVGREWVDSSRRWEYLDFIEQCLKSGSLNCLRIASAVWLLLGHFADKLPRGMESINHLKPEERECVFKIAFHFASDKQRFREKYKEYCLFV